MKSIDIEQGGLFGYGSSRKQIARSTFAVAYGSGGMLYKQLKFVEDFHKEDETISCKDKSSGVKCIKVKKGNHFKPFYQTSRY